MLCLLGRNTEYHTCWIATLLVGTAQEIVKEMSPFAKRRWRKPVKAIVIEECSMLGGVFFDKFHEVACLLLPEKAHLPFAGVRIILVGDFAQLAPMSDLEVIEGSVAAASSAAGVGPWLRPTAP